MEVESCEEKIIFKKKKRKNFRQKLDDTSDHNDSEEENQNNLAETLEESKELRKLRRKHGGISAEALLHGNKKDKNKNDDDPYKSKTGGMLDVNAVKNAPKMDDAYDTGIGTSFSVETHRRDEDAEMQKFIEQNLARRKGHLDDENKTQQTKYFTPEESALKSVPEFLIKNNYKRNEEMLSNQMLSGIPEVDLGIEAKIRNIESTEEAKQIALKNSMQKKEKPSEFVPRNLAVNFIQHNKSNMAEGSSIIPVEKKATKPKIVQEIVEPVVGGGIKISTMVDKKKDIEKATDDFHLEKFKKKFKRN